MMKSYEKFEFCPCGPMGSMQASYSLRPEIGRHTAFRMDNDQVEVRMEQSAHRMDVQSPMDAAFRMVSQVNEKEII